MRKRWNRQRRWSRQKRWNRSEQSAGIEGNRVPECGCKSAGCWCYHRTPEGIDYTHPAFINADGTSRIRCIWDQSIPFRGQDSDSTKAAAAGERSGKASGQEPLAGRRPDIVGYGTEYTRDDINRALASTDPWSVVPCRDPEGHGTFMAGVAGGTENPDNGFRGVAPLVEFAVVKCKPCKENLKEYYRLSTSQPCFMENDIMMGVRYLNNVAYQQQKPLVICIGTGTSLGSHNQGGALGEVLQSYGSLKGVVIVTAGGNEANAAHHYHSPVMEANGETDVELKVAGGREGFTMDLWCDAPKLCSVGLISPGGEYSGKVYARLGARQRLDFFLEETMVDVEYLLVSFESGDECIRMRFRTPQEGIWRIRVFNETNLPTDFDIWLPIRGFVSEETVFLRPDPDITLCEPSNNAQVITTSYYQGASRSVAIESSRGYNRRGDIEPNFAAPGTNIYGPLPRLGNYIPADEEERRQTARYGYRTGSSAAAAVASGAGALLAEWGLVRGNDPTMNTVVVQKYLVRGADRTGRSFPNREWGYGTLDLYGVFRSLQQREARNVTGE